MKRNGLMGRKLLNGHTGVVYTLTEPSLHPEGKEEGGLAVTVWHIPKEALLFRSIG